MTSPTLARLERQLKLKREQAEQAPPPAGNSDLGVALEQLIRQAAQAGADAAVEKQKPNPPPPVPLHRQPFTSRPDQHEFPAGPPQAKPVRDLTISLQRDSAGNLLYAQVGDVRFEIQRNAEGRVARMVQVDESPVLPPPPGEAR